MLDLEPSDFESVRKLVDVTLTADQLSDDVLSLDGYEGEAVRWVAERTSNEDDHARQAAIYYLTGLVLPAVPRYLSESNAGYSYQLQQQKLDERLAQLQAAADAAIARSEAANPTEVGTAYLDATSLRHFDVAEADLTTLLWWQRPNGA